MKSRNTKQKELLNEELKKLNSFFTVHELFKTVEKKESKIGIATVYRFLSEKAKLKEIYSYTCEGKNLYSIKKNSHCHFICEKTGKVFHFEIENLDFLKHIKNKIPGLINSIELEIRGTFKN